MCCSTSRISCRTGAGLTHASGLTGIAYPTGWLSVPYRPATGARERQVGEGSRRLASSRVRKFHVQVLPSRRRLQRRTWQAIQPGLWLGRKLPSHAHTPQWHLWSSCPRTPHGGKPAVRDVCRGGPVSTAVNACGGCQSVNVASIVSRRGGSAERLGDLVEPTMMHKNHPGAPIHPVI